MLEDDRLLLNVRPNARRFILQILVPFLQFLQLLFELLIPLLLPHPHTTSGFSVLLALDFDRRLRLLNRL